VVKIINRKHRRAAAKPVVQPVATLSYFLNFTFSPFREMWRVVKYAKNFID